MGVPEVTTPLTAKDVHGALYRHFSDRWAQLTEVTARPKPGVSRRLPGSKPRRIDVLLVRAAAQLGADPFERLAIEIKVSRADFLSDVRNPHKQAPWRALAHRHAYAAPKGMIAAAELPAGSGLISVSRQSWDPRRCAVEWAVRARRPAGHVPDPLPLANIMDAFWRAGRAEARAKGYADLDDDPAIDDLRTEVARLQHELELAVNRIDRAVESRKHWQRAYGAIGAPPCSTCGHPLRPKLKGYSTLWVHPDPHDAGACELLRRVAAELADAGQPDDYRSFGGRYLRVPDPEPVDLPDGVPTIDERIEASSLGTPEAKALRDSVPEDVGRAIVERSEQFGGL